MLIDHLFIFSNNQGKEADQLVEFGITEGSSRVHPGQGTTNRKFYFENFFLEVLWVSDEVEIQSELIAPTQLWERSQFQHNAYSRFGMCLLNTPTTDDLFQVSSPYQPEYFPERMIIDFISLPHFPWTFRLPFKGPKKPTTEPLEHANGLRKLSSLTFGVPHLQKEEKFLSYFHTYPFYSFEAAPSFQLTLQFDEGKQGKRWKCEALALEITW